MSLELSLSPDWKRTFSCRDYSFEILESRRRENLVRSSMLGDAADV